MKRIIIIFLLFYCSSLCYCQKNEGATIVCDTIDCDAFMVIVQLPKLSVMKAQTFHYEEGFFKTYPHVQYPNNTCDFLDIHCGAMNKSSFFSEPRDSVLYSRKIGDRGISTKIIYNDICSRQDYYPNKSLTITYGYFNIDIDSLLPHGNHEFTDKIMDNILIVKKERCQISGNGSQDLRNERPEVER